jgi:hypothetical protein
MLREQWRLRADEFGQRCVAVMLRVRQVPQQEARAVHREGLGNTSAPVPLYAGGKGGRREEAVDLTALHLAPRCHERPAAPLVSSEVGAVVWKKKPAEGNGECVCVIIERLGLTVRHAADDSSLACGASFCSVVQVTRMHYRRRVVPRGHHALVVLKAPSAALALARD